MAKSDGRSADATKKASNNFRPSRRGFKAPTEGLQHVIFHYTNNNNNKNMFVENVKNSAITLPYPVVAGTKRLRGLGHSGH